jgi:hypothetical protein
MVNDVTSGWAMSIFGTVVIGVSRLIVKFAFVYAGRACQIFCSFVDRSGTMPLDVKAGQPQFLLKGRQS